MLHCPIAGFTYYEGVLAFSKLKIGTELQMVPESENKYDSKAVALYLDDLKLGYLPKSDNRIISVLLELGINCFEARVQQLDKAEHPEQQVGIIVYAVRK